MVADPEDDMLFSEAFGDNEDLQPPAEDADVESEAEDSGEDTNNATQDDSDLILNMPDDPADLAVDDNPVSKTKRKKLQVQPTSRKRKAGARQATKCPICNQAGHIREHCPVW